MNEWTTARLETVGLAARRPGLLTGLERSATGALGSWTGATTGYLLVGAVVCLLGLGATGSISMEGMVADAASSMVTTGDWIVPRIYGEVYTYKPALAYWLAAVPYLFNDQPSELALRLPFVACGLAMGLLVLLLIGSLTDPRIGFWSAVASITAAAYVQKAQVGEFDVVVTAGVGVAVAAACFNLSAASPRPAVWIVAYLGLAFGFLAKGMPALMAYGPGLLLAALANRRLRSLFRWDHLAAAAMFLTLIGSYLWAGYADQGASFFQQPLEEAQVRGLEWTFERAALTLAKPAIIFAVLLPWTVVLPFLLADRSWIRGTGPEAHLIRAGAAFLAGGALAFMTTPTHEVRYYLPLCVSAAILCGVTLGRRGELDSKWSRWRARTAVVVAAVAAAGTVLSGLLLSAERVPLANRTLLVVAGLAASVALRWLATDPRRRLAPILLLAALSVSMAENFGYRPHRAWKRSLEEVAEAFRPLVPVGEPVWVLGPADMAGKHCSLLFYLDRSILAFRRGERLPPAGARFVFDARELAVIEPAQQAGWALEFSLEKTFVHPYSTYYLATISSSR